MTNPYTEDSALARALAAPRESREHRTIRADCYDGGLLGSDGRCRYCFGMLSGKNAFAMNRTTLRNELRSFLSGELPARSAALCSDGPQWDEVFASYLHNRLHVVETGEPLPKRSKEHRAIDAVLLNPTLSDNDVRDLLKTTEKQMRRWSTYGMLRRALARNSTG